MTPPRLAGGYSIGYLRGVARGSGGSLKIKTVMLPGGILIPPKIGAGFVIDNDFHYLY